MPIDRKLFEFAHDPSSAIRDYLSKEPDNAFTVTEIYENIDLFHELGIPLQKIKDTLEILIRSGEVEVAWVQGEGHYIINKSLFF